MRVEINGRSKAKKSKENKKVYITSLLFEPRCICLAREAILFTLTCTLSANLIFDSTNRLRALVLDAEAMLYCFSLIVG